MLEYFKLIKEGLKDPKKKSITLLIIYFIFFIFVFAIIKNAGETSSPVNVEKETTPLENYKSMIGYDYNATYYKLDTTDVISGTYYKDTSLFTFNSNKYYYDQETYFLEDNLYSIANIEYNVSKIFNNNFNILFDNFNEISKTTYTDGKETINYEINSKIIYNYLYGVDTLIDSNVGIEVTYNTNYITNILIDLTNIGENLVKINIEYSNIDNIKSLEFNKENYTYRE